MTDSGNNRVEEFSPTGTYLRQFGSSGLGVGQFSTPTAIAVDSSGNVWILNTHGVLVQKFSATGTYISGFGTKGWFAGAARGLAISGGNLYVTEPLGRVQEYSTTGTSLAIVRRTGLGQRQIADPLGHRLRPDHGQPVRHRRRSRPRPGVQLRGGLHRRLRLWARAPGSSQTQRRWRSAPRATSSSPTRATTASRNGLRNSAARPARHGVGLADAGGGPTPAPMVGAPRGAKPARAEERAPRLARARVGGRGPCRARDAHRVGRSCAGRSASDRGSDTLEQVVIEDRRRAR